MKICKECGYKASELSTHLRNDCVGVQEYLKKHNLKQEDLFDEVALLQKKALIRHKKKTDETLRSVFGVGSAQMKVSEFDKPTKTTPNVDSDYIFTKETIELMCMALNDPEEKVLITGATGSGKSSLVEQVAARLNYGFYRVNFDNEVSKSELLGQWTVQSGEMVFQYGIIPKAMLEGAILLIDEWDCAPAGIAMVLQAVLEGKPLNLLDTKESIYPADDFRVFATSNTIGLGDETGLYQGTMPQNFAQLDRFTTVVRYDYPNKPAERKILVKNTGITEGDADNLIEVAKLVRKGHLKGEMFATMSTRTLLNIAKKIDIFEGDINTALTYAFYNKLSSDDMSVVKEFVQRVYGEENMIAEKYQFKPNEGDSDNVKVKDTDDMLYVKPDENMDFTNWLKVNTKETYSNFVNSNTAS